MRPLSVLIVTLTFFLSHWGTTYAQTNEEAYSLANTSVIDLTSTSNGIDYQLYVHVPPACSAPDAECPAVYMLDAEYSFALSSQIVSHLSDRNRVPPLISVAIGYPDKSQYRRFRTRDYTPYFHGDGGYSEELQKESGGGPGFLSVIENDIVPFVEETFAASDKERTLVGHSYGGLFALYAWITSPELFDNYLIVSPSLWYADGKPLADAAEACAASEFSKTRDLYLAVGEYEEQPQNGRTMVSDLNALQKILDACTARKTSTYLRVFEDETHASIFPAALSTGIRKHFQ